MHCQAPVLHSAAAPRAGDKMAREDSPRRYEKKPFGLEGGGSCLPRALEPKHGSNTTLSGRHRDKTRSVEIYDFRVATRPCSYVRTSLRSASTTWLEFDFRFFVFWFVMQ